MPDTQEQGKPSGTERRATDRGAASSVTARQLAKAAGDVYGALQDITASVKLLRECMQQGGEAQDASLLQLQDRAERMETNVSTLQRTMDLVVDRVNDPRTREKEFLGSLLAALLDVGDTLDTVKQALAGLTLQVQIDRESCSCAWRDYLAKNQAASEEAVIFDNLAKISDMAPLLNTFIRDAISQRGFDPDTGKKREWLMVQIDRVRASVSNIVISLLAAGLLGFLFWLWGTYGNQNDILRLRKDLADAVQHYQEAEAAKTKSDAAYQDLQDQNQVLARELRRVVPPAKVESLLKPVEEPGRDSRR